jgi:hypothetical protein
VSLERKASDEIEVVATGLDADGRRLPLGIEDVVTLPKRHMAHSVGRSDRPGT